MGGIHSLDKIVHGKLNLINVSKEEFKIDLGKTTPDGGKFALKSLTSAMDALKNNAIDLLLTAPINKDNIQSKEFDFPGHTEYLENNLEGKIWNPTILPCQNQDGHHLAKF